MKITRPDGSVLELQTPEEVEQYLILTGQVVRKTEAQEFRERINEGLAAKQAEAQVMTVSVPQAVNGGNAPVTSIARSPEPVKTLPRVFYVTPNENQVLDVIRMYDPQGVTTGEIGELLGWTGQQASSVLSKLNNRMFNRRQLTMRLPHRKYVLTELAKKSAFQVTHRYTEKQAEWDYENGY